MNNTKIATLCIAGGVIIFAIVVGMKIFGDGKGKTPDDPTSLVATVSGTRINLKWRDNSKNEVKFEIERDDGSSGFVPLIMVRGVTGHPNIVTYGDISVAAGNTYRYRVRAVNSKGNESDYSNEVSGSVSVPGIGTPAASSPTSVSKHGYTVKDFLLVEYKWKTITVPPFSIYLISASGGDVVARDPRNPDKEHEFRPGGTPGSVGHLPYAEFEVKAKDSSVSGVKLTLYTKPK